MKDKTDIRCGLFTLSPFPIGNVSTVRYSSYMVALASNKIFSKVYLLTPTKTAYLNKNANGVYKGVNYKYLQGIVWSGKVSTLVKAFYYLKGLFLAFREMKRDKLTCVILYHQSLFAYFLFWIATRIMNIKFITDKSEYPYGYRQMNVLHKKIMQISLKAFDGFIVMTNELSAFYSRYKKKKASVFHLPMTIDPERFSSVVKDNLSFEYIAIVCGTHNRDGLYESIKSYSFYCKKTTNALPLKIIGDIENFRNKEEIFKLVNEEGLSKRIFFLGKIPIVNVPKILVNAKILLTTANEYISGGFPTKLGEYMLSGVPVVATKVGELPHYLADRINVFFAKARDYEDISDQLIYVQNNYKMALDVAANAKDTAKTIFNADTYIHDFIAYLKK